MKLLHLDRRKLIAAISLLIFTLSCAQETQKAPKTQGVLSAEEKLITAYYNLAQALLDTQNTQNINLAIENYNKALELNPTHIASLINMGKIYLEHKNNYNKAIELFEKVLSINPPNNQNNKSNKSNQVTYLLANAYVKKNNREQAITYYKKAIKQNPTHIAAYKELIKLFCDTKEYKAAIKVCNKALKKEPLNKEIRNKLIELLQADGQYDKALQYCNALIKEHPRDIKLQITKAQILTSHNKFAKAIPIFEQLSTLQPNNIKIIYNIGYLYKKIGAYEKAIHILTKVKNKDPNNKKARLSLGESYLALGYYKLGWKEIDAYNTKKLLPTKLKNLSEIAGKTIFIQSEWYPKDMVLLIRYAKLLKDMGAKAIIVQTLPQLAQLFQKCPYIDKVLILNKDKICPFDKFMQISSLPHLLGTTIETVPCEIPYLFPDKTLCDFWAKQLAHNSSPPLGNTPYHAPYKVGIYLTKNSGITPSQLLEIANLENISIYILSKITEHNYLQNISNKKIVYMFGKGFADTQEDIAQLCAIMPQLDLVITGGSLVAHLAGALGVNTWVMLPEVTSWHWLTSSDNSPWYPTVKLFRKNNHKKNWEEIIEKMITKLKKHIAQKASNS